MNRRTTILAGTVGCWAPFVGAGAQVVEQPKPRAELAERVEVIQQRSPVQPARGGRIARVTVRLTKGRAVSFHEVAAGGLVTACETRAEAFALARAAALTTRATPPWPRPGR
jgi:hypothetical protein